MDLSKLGRTEKVLAAGGLLLFIFSFLPWYSVSGGGQSISFDAWQDPSGLNDWFPILLLLVYGVILALPAFGVAVTAPALAEARNRAFIGLVLSAFAVLLFAIQGLTYPSAGDLGALGISAGPAWSYYISLIIALAALVQSYLGFTQAGGTFAQIGAAFQARSQQVRQNGQPAFGQAPEPSQPQEPPQQQQQPPAGS